MLTVVRHPGLRCVVPRGQAWCAFSTSLVRTFRAFTPVVFTPHSVDDGATNEEAALLLAPTVGLSWDSHIQTDQTYQARRTERVLACAQSRCMHSLKRALTCFRRRQVQVYNASAFTWRRYPRGAPPIGARGRLIRCFPFARCAHTRPAPSLNSSHSVSCSHSVGRWLVRAACVRRQH
jgi:hypothetical protein